MVRRLKTSHAGAVHQYAPQEQYGDFHDGDTDEEIVMEPTLVAAPDPILVTDDEEDTEEVIQKKKSQLVSQTKRSRRQEEIWKVTMVQRWRKSKSKSKMKQLRK
jgi:hypothetical protein